MLIPYDANLEDVDYSFLKKQNIVESAALILRQAIMDIELSKLPVQINTTDLLKGECEIPEILSNFYKILIGGLNRSRQKSQKNKRLVNSLSSDAIFSVTHGKTKPAKHLTLGLAIKSLTGSKKLVSLLNRFGHCCSYTIIEEMETEVTFTATERSRICPPEIKLLPGLNTSLAFDNYDRYIDTKDGHNTMHDTVGIIFQDISEDCDSCVNDRLDNTNSNNSFQVSGVKRRRTFETFLPDIQPLGKRPKMVETLIPLDSELRNVHPSNLKQVRYLDFLWMVSHALGITTPMWVGFNSMIYEDPSKKQIIAYTNPINISPTDLGVVKETLLQSLEIKEECQDTYVSCSYDLAIAKPALQIQSMEKATLKNCFIHVGTFHIQLAYKKALGKVIDGCGITDIMVDTKLIANGSVASFLHGKNFNRCKRLHPLMAVALQSLHFEEFLEIHEIEITEEIKAYIEDFQNHRSKEPKIESENLLKILDEYNKFYEDTLNGVYGKSSKYYLFYVQFVNYYLILSRAIRTSDTDLFKYVLPKITNLFFALNQPNYSRWLVKYHDNLIKIDETHPGLINQLKAGGLGIKRTNKPFSRQPIDLTVEQTVNADASNRWTGISCFTNQIAAKQRWSKGNGVRSTIISNVMKDAGLISREDITDDLRPASLKKNLSQIRSFKEGVKTRLNPFSTSIDKNFLFNISSGKAAPIEVESFLNNIEKLGNERREKFIKECDDETRFERPIERVKIVNFSKFSNKKNKKQNDKVGEMKIQRDIFGRLLGISLKADLDIAAVLRYPLTEVPLSLCHYNGMIHKTDKSKLAHIIANEVKDHSPKKQYDTVIIDGFFFLYLLRDLPKTVGKVALKILSTIVKFPADTIHLIFDRYPPKSIKDNEHLLRENHFGREYTINGPDTERPADFHAELRNKHFKNSFVNFIIKYWGEAQEAVEIIGKKIIRVDYEECHEYKVENERIITNLEYNFECPSHIEADTKIVNHIFNLPRKNRILIRCSDTDIIIITLSHMEKLERTNKVIHIQVGTGNNTSNMDMNKIYAALGKQLSASLIGFHAFTGCDFNPSFYRRAKVRPFNLLRKSEEAQKAFIALSNYSLTEKPKEMAKIFKQLEKFLCEMYNHKGTNDIDKVRFSIFMSCFETKKVDEKFSRNVTKYDASSLPPCSSELYQHLKRTLYIATMWGNAHLKHPIPLYPGEYGWKEIDDKFTFHWFDGERVPIQVKDILRNPKNEDVLKKPTKVKSKSKGKCNILLSIY